MATTQKLLGEAVGIQFTGTRDETGTNPILGLTDGLIVGRFRRGRMDKPMRITQQNIRAELGYQPNNKFYQAVQDALDNFPHVDVLRVGEVGSSPETIKATYESLDQTMTVTGDAGLAVATRDSNDNVIGSGIIGSDGTVTYPLNTAGQVNNAPIYTKSALSNTVPHSLSLVDEVEPPSLIGCDGATDSLYLRVLLNRVEFGGKFTITDAESSEIIVSIDGTGFLEAPDFVEALNINPAYVDKLDFITFAPTSYYADGTVQGLFQIKNIHTSNIRLNVDLRDMGSGQNNLTTLGILVLQPNTPALVFNENDSMESKYNLSACLAP